MSDYVRRIGILFGVQYDGSGTGKIVNDVNRISNSLKKSVGEVAAMDKQLERTLTSITTRLAPIYEAMGAKAGAAFTRGLTQALSHADPAMRNVSMLGALGSQRGTLRQGMSGAYQQWITDQGFRTKAGGQYKVFPTSTGYRTWNEKLWNPALGQYLQAPSFNQFMRETPYGKAYHTLQQENFSALRAQREIIASRQAQGAFQSALRAGPIVQGGFSARYRAQAYQSWTRGLQDQEAAYLNEVMRLRDFKSGGGRYGVSAASNKWIQATAARNVPNAPSAMLYSRRYDTVPYSGRAPMHGLPFLQAGGGRQAQINAYNRIGESAFTSSQLQTMQADATARWQGQVSAAASMRQSAQNAMSRRFSGIPGGMEEYAKSVKAAASGQAQFNQQFARSMNMMGRTAVALMFFYKLNQSITSTVGLAKELELVAARTGAIVGTAYPGQGSFANRLQLQKDVLNIGARRGIRDPRQVGVAINTAFQAADMPTNRALGISDLAARMATSTGQNVETLTNILMGAHNAFKIYGPDLEHFAEQLIQTWADGVLTFEEAETGLGKIFQTAKLAGFQGREGLDQMLGLTAAVTKEAGSAARNMTMLARTFSEITKPQTLKKLEKEGIIFDPRDPMGLLSQIMAREKTEKETTGQSFIQGSGIFGRELGRRGLGIIYSQWDYIQERIEDASTTFSMLDTSYATVMDSMAKRTDKLIAHFQKLQWTVGRDVAGAIDQAVRPLIATLDILDQTGTPGVTKFTSSPMGGLVRGAGIAAMGLGVTSMGASVLGTLLGVPATGGAATLPRGLVGIGGLGGRLNALRYSATGNVNALAAMQQQEAMFDYYRMRPGRQLNMYPIMPTTAQGAMWRGPAGGGGFMQSLYASTPAARGFMRNIRLQGGRYTPMNVGRALFGGRNAAGLRFGGAAAMPLGMSGNLIAGGALAAGITAMLVRSAMINTYQESMAGRISQHQRGFEDNFADFKNFRDVSTRLRGAISDTPTTTIGKRNLVNQFNELVAEYPKLFSANDKLTVSNEELAESFSSIAAGMNEVLDTATKRGWGEAVSEFLVGAKLEQQLIMAGMRDPINQLGKGFALGFGGMFAGEGVTSTDLLDDAFIGEDAQIAASTRSMLLQLRKQSSEARRQKRRQAAAGGLTAEELAAQEAREAQLEEGAVKAHELVEATQREIEMIEYQSDIEKQIGVASEEELEHKKNTAINSALAEMHTKLYAMNMEYSADLAGQVYAEMPDLKQSVDDATDALGDFSRSMANVAAHAADINELLSVYQGKLESFNSLMEGQFNRATYLQQYRQGYANALGAFSQTMAGVYAPEVQGLASQLMKNRAFGLDMEISATELGETTQLYKSRVQQEQLNQTGAWRTEVSAIDSQITAIMANQPPGADRDERLRSLKQQKAALLERIRAKNEDVSNSLWYQMVAPKQQALAGSMLNILGGSLSVHTMLRDTQFPSSARGQIEGLLGGPLGKNKYASPIDLYNALLASAGGNLEGLGGDLQGVLTSFGALSQQFPTWKSMLADPEAQAKVANMVDELYRQASQDLLGLQEADLSTTISQLTDKWEIAKDKLTPEIMSEMENVKSALAEYTATMRAITDATRAEFGMTPLQRYSATGSGAPALDSSSYAYTAPTGGSSQTVSTTTFGEALHPQQHSKAVTDAQRRVDTLKGQLSAVRGSPDPSAKSYIPGLESELKVAEEDLRRLQGSQNVYGMVLEMMRGTEPGSMSQQWKLTGQAASPGASCTACASMAYRGAGLLGQNELYTHNQAFSDRLRELGFVTITDWRQLRAGDQVFTKSFNADPAPDHTYTALSSPDKTGKLRIWDNQNRTWANVTTQDANNAFDYALRAPAGFEAPSVSNPLPVQIVDTTQQAGLEVPKAKDEPMFPTPEQLASMPTDEAVDFTKPLSDQLPAAKKLDDAATDLGFTGAAGDLSSAAAELSAAAWSLASAAGTAVAVGAGAAGDNPWAGMGAAGMGFAEAMKGDAPISGTRPRTTVPNRRGGVMYYKYQVQCNDPKG